MYDGAGGKLFQLVNIDKLEAYPTLGTLTYYILKVMAQLRSLYRLQPGL